MIKSVGNWILLLEVEEVVLVGEEVFEVVVVGVVDEWLG